MAERGAGERGGRNERGGAGERGRGRPGGARGGNGRGATTRIDPSRQAAYDVLRAVAGSDAYANLVLPGLLAERELSGRDAGFATELAYGTLRLRGRYDAILAMCSSRGLTSIDPGVLDALRLGAHQVLGMRVAQHAAVSETVDLVRANVSPGAASFANAVMRQVTRADAAEWERRMAERTTDADDLLGQRLAHPAWIVRALRESLALDGGTPAGRLEAELVALLEADNAAPAVTLVARPGLVDERELTDAVEDGVVTPAGLAPTAWRLAGGSPDALPAVRQGRMGVQDEGSQLVALALAGVTVTDGDSQWADVCAGPGGKSALLGAVLAQRTDELAALGALDRPSVLVAGEVQPHRVGLVERSVKALPPELLDVVQWDGRELGTAHPGRFDRVLVDAPCTGLGALRRRPEARWRRTPADLKPLALLQRELLDAALDATRPGGVVGYVTCSPHVAETRAVVEAVTRSREDVEVLDAVAAVNAVVGRPVEGLAGPYVQLWPHRHGTDAMFLALLRRV
ncbi:methyltransferase [Serinibacter arcticus]|uniref:Methyltransferase n=1 Tax=Serinibacter arcticus TaxID=1655435 RepID=A0A2U1ZRV7_9MICO|nr:transcription antitermination factor NusB [Serinibacter arcticus]PWD49725.1 methyltransferase [Serinibacter arcticus]